MDLLVTYMAHTKEKYDNVILRHSGLLEQLQKHAQTPNGDLFCSYCNPAYPLWIHLQAPINTNPNLLQEEFDFQISKVWITIEWLFNKIVKYFAFIDF